jgi:hypothetical protein
MLEWVVMVSARAKGFFYGKGGRLCKGVLKNPGGSRAGRQMPLGFQPPGRRQSACQDNRNGIKPVVAGN